MKQRLGLAQAMMENPDILILDEPMNALDSIGVSDIREILLDLKEQGKLVILASHIHEDIEILCDEVMERSVGCKREPNNTIIVFYKIIRYTMINSYSGFFYGGFDG